MRHLESMPKVVAWPTPGASPDTRAESAESKAARGSGGINLLEAATLAPWPTPTAMEGGSTSRSGNRKGELLIGGLIQGLIPWPTPQAASPDAGNSDYSRQIDVCMGLREEKNSPFLPHGPTTTSSTAATARRGVLDAAFSRWLMGFPPIWDAASPNFDDYLLALALVARDD